MLQHLFFFASHGVFDGHGNGFMGSTVVHNNATAATNATKSTIFIFIRYITIKIVVSYSVFFLYGRTMNVIAWTLGPVLGGWLSSPEIDRRWYDSLRKPGWTPPNAMFGPVWTLLYACMGYAASRVSPSSRSIFGLQLLLNYSWSYVFFVKKDLDLAAFHSIALLGTVAATWHAFSREDGLAGALMIPNVAWAAFAAVLSLRIRAMNVTMRPGYI